jgi:hypothetical protein
MKLCTATCSHSHRPAQTRSNGLRLAPELLNSTAPVADFSDIAHFPPRIEMKSFPIELQVFKLGEAANDRTWSVNLSSAPKTCYYCNYTGKCMHDYPGAGSGKDHNGNPEYYCSGSGKCQKCYGTGYL